MSGPVLQTLEEWLDDCLMLARGTNAESLETIISYLRRTRNAVVSMQSE